jgi:Spy/CpxP family protein refolding chaperone
MRKTLKTIVASLLIGSASLALAAQANAAPAGQQTPPSQHELNWMDRASKNFDGGGN